MKLSVARWKYAKKWVYSITYDEALADLAKFVIPTHTDLGIPGHVEVVAGQIGVIRNIGGSSFDGYRHMNAAELRELVSMGWGVGCHSWSHQIVMDDPDLELGKARETIEQAIGSPVTLFCAPGCNDNLTNEVHELLPKYGYMAAMSIADDVNRPEDMQPYFVYRVPLHERYWGPFDCAYDSHRRITQAILQSGWIIDYCHCPLERAVHDYKDVNEKHHRERLEAVVQEGGIECWYANPDDVIDYNYMQRFCSIEETGEGVFSLRIPDLPKNVKCRELTFVVDTFRTVEVLGIDVDGKSVQLVPYGAGSSIFTASVKDGSAILITHRKD